jgi:predicted RNA-binding protein associated with RNAse of E/G family
VSLKVKKIIERKIRYDSKIVDYPCRLLTIQKQSAVLFHIIEESFTMIANRTSLTIPIGSYTIAYYWENLPYNLYFWRDNKGNYLGSYLNIVKNTTITDELVSFEDLIIDIMVLSNGEYFILDENELPEPIEHFENGFVKQTLSSVIESLTVILSQVISESKGIYKHERFIPLLEKFVNKHI